MMKRIWALCLLLLWPFWPAEAKTDVAVSFPYSLTETAPTVPQGSTQLLYVTAEHVNVPREETLHVAVELPDGFAPEAGGGWTIAGQRAETQLSLSADYGQNMAVLSVAASEVAAVGTHTARVTFSGAGLSETKEISFTVAPGQTEKTDKKGAAKKSLGWYIQSVVTPVSADGTRQSGAEQNTLYVRDVQLENIRHRLTGGGAVDWSTAFSEPATYVLAELRNPKKDVRSLRFRAELVDRKTGAAVPGLVTPSGHSGMAPTARGATEAVISLDGNIVQGVVLPLYVDPFEIEEGDYSLRTTVWDESSSRTNESPLTIVKKRNVGFFALAVATICALGILLFSGKLCRRIKTLGAGGDIAVALFASLAFGSVVLPVTLLGDFLHVFLGPFSSLVTGLLSGVLQYLLLFALLTLFRRPGVAALFFLMKWLLAGILFGRFTPVAALNYAVYIGVLETVLYASGFYRGEEITRTRLWLTALLAGVADMAITFLNLEQLMFFYRLYYADWFIGLFVIVNGLVYSSLGAFLGMKLGKKLSGVMSQ